MADDSFRRAVADAGFELAPASKIDVEGLRHAA
jgi:hypothetical protein